MSNVHEDPLDRQYAPGWRPEEGEKVRGTVVDLDLASRDSDYGGGSYPVVTIRLADGYAATTKDGTSTDEVAIHLIHSSLAGKLATIEPKVGDAIGVKFVGEPLGSAKSKRYRVDRSHDGGGEPSAAIDWADYRFPDDKAVSPAATSGFGEPLEQLEAQAATEMALVAERDERDAAASDDAAF